MEDRTRAYLPEHIQTIRDRLRELGKKAEIQIYPEAGHGFLCDERESYNAEAAKNGWDQNNRLSERTHGLEQKVGQLTFRRRSLTRS